MLRRPFRWLIATAAASLAFAVLPAAALAASPPVIEWASAWNLTQNDATLGAGINTNGLYTGYEFQIDTNASYDFTQFDCPFSLPGFAKCESITVGEPLPVGLVEPSPEYIPAESGKQSVSLDLASIGATLQPGREYHYRVLASNGGQTVVGPDQTFTTLTPGTPPAIESESASSITSTDATLEAKIDPEGLETTYEFYLEAPSCANDKRVLACEASGGIPIGKGTIPAGSAQTVSVDVAATGHILTPDTIEGYRIVASNSAGTRYGGEKTFVTLRGPPPVVESVSLSHLTATDATLEAKINTEGQATTYQFYMWSSCAHERCEYMRPIPLPPGRLLPSFVAQSVSLDLNSVGVTLRSGEEYGWGVTATNDGGERASANGGVFEPPEGVFEPLSSKVTPEPGGGQPPASGSSDQPAGAGTPSSPVLQVSSPLGGSAKTGTGKPKPAHGKDHKRKHHSTKAAAHQQTKAKKHKR